MIDKFDKNTLLENFLKNPTMKIIELLDENENICNIKLLCELTLDNNEKIPQKFILNIKKLHFDSENILNNKLLLFPICSESKNTFHNQQYYKYITTDIISNKNNVELIFPVTEKIIEKYRKANLVIISETYDMYLNKTLKYINSIDKNDTLWITNIFEGKSESIFYKNDLFILVKNYTDKKGIDYLGFPFDSKIKCLRDLNEKHLELLESFYYEGKKVLKEKCGVNENKIRAFIHYPPSFYYFHVHYLDIDKEDYNVCIYRAIDLGEVIRNIKIKRDYYQTITIDHSVKVGSKLYEILNN